MKELRNKIVNFYYDKKILSTIVFAFLFSFVIVTLMSSTASFLYPLAGFSEYCTDSNIFFYIGRMLNHGAVPYKDVFDHKGLYLFYYMQLGTVGNTKVVLYLMQLLFYTVTVSFMLLTLRECKIRFKTSLVALTLFSFILIVSALSVSDFEIQYPFVAATLFYFTKYVVHENKKDLFVGSILAGISAGVAINIRASDAMVGFAFYLFAIVELLRKKNIKDFFLLSLVTLLSFVVIASPVFLIAYSKGFLNEMFEATILDNFKYVGSITGGINLLSVSSRITIAILAVLTVILVYSTRKQTSLTFKLYSLIVILFILLLQFVIALYLHYLFVCIPLFICFFTYTITRFNISQKLQSFINCFSCFCLLCSAIVMPTIYYSVIYKRTVDVKEYVDAKISLEDKEGKTLALNLPTSIYVNSNIYVSYGDFSVQSYHVQISEKYSLNNLYSYIESNDCNYVITYNQDESTKDQFIKHMYDLCDSLIYKKIEDSNFLGSKYIIIWEHLK